MKNKSKQKKITTATQKKVEIDQNSSHKPHNTVCCGERHRDTITISKGRWKCSGLKSDDTRKPYTNQQGVDERASGNCGKCKCSAVCQTLLCANDINGYLWGSAKAPGSSASPSTDLLLTAW